MELAVSACATTFTPGLNNILLLSSTNTFTPGPNNILLLSSTSTFGFHPGRIVAFALVLALLLVWCAWKIVKT